jgi:hypothetical protein
VPFRQRWVRMKTHYPTLGQQLTDVKRVAGPALVFGDAHGRLFGLGEEDAAAADAEGVVRGLGCARDLDGFFVDDRPKESANAEGRMPNGRIGDAELFFFVVRGQEDLAVAGEPFDEVSHEGWRKSTHCGSRYRKIVR